MRRWIWMAVGALWAVALPLQAQDIPPVLKDWQGWVLHDAPEHLCPQSYDAQADSEARQCIWPGRLNLDATGNGANFNLTVHVDARGWVSLPGDRHAWPQQVTVDNRPLAVLSRSDVPSVWLEPGDYVLRGHVSWTERPAQLAVPDAIGLVSLTIDGAAVSDIDRADGQVTLGEAAEDKRVADALSVNVYRRLADGVPMMLETQVQLHVSGSAREQWLGPALPQGFVATSLKSDLPARLENDGRVRVQLRPGDWTMTLKARASDAIQHVAMPRAPAPWPVREIWSYADNASLRRSQVNGVGTDAAQVGVPDAWQNLPAYALDKDNGLAIEQGARGNEGGKGEKLLLVRDMWLDFDGGGLTVADRITGNLHNTQRLNVAAPWQLQRVSQDEKPLLVTTDAKGQQGVELRDKELSLDAGLRSATHGGRLPVAGWSSAFETVDTNVHLPYGYVLLAAPGADRADSTWIARWTLLDLFVVALITLLAGRWLGWVWVLPVLGFLVLSQHENDAPRWTLGVAIALALLWRVLPGQGRLRKLVRIGASASLILGILWALPFAADQVSYAMHPQLEAEAGSVDEVLDALPLDFAGAVKQEVRPIAAAPPPPAPAAPPAEYGNAPKVRLAPGVLKSLPIARRAAPAQLEAIVVAGTRMSPYSAASYEFDTHSVIQAGSGIPSWNVGNNYRLSWSGPVTSNQAVRLMVVPSWLVRVLRIAMLALLALWLGRSVRSLWTTPGPRDSGGVQAASLVLTGLLALTLVPHIAQAQGVPNKELLDELRHRLTEAPQCMPECAAVAQAQVQGNGSQIAVDMEVHAGAAVAFALPHVDDGIALQSVALDGRADAPVSRGDDGKLWLRVERGVHRMALRYDAGKRDTVTLHFAVRPQRVQVAGSGWSASGLDAEQLLGDSLTLSHISEARQAGTPAATQAFPPFVTVTRTLNLDVDWTVTTTVTRVAPDDGGFSIDLPLLPGEHPGGQDVRVHDGKISVTLNASQNSLEWESRLDRSPELVLEAPPLGQRAEEWFVQAAPVLHVETEGVPASLSDVGLRFQPLPGERLRVRLSQPQAVAGQYVAFDRANVSHRVGERATTADLMLVVRSTRGGEHAIDVPTGAVLLDARRDDVPVSLSIRDGKLGLPLLPGLHRFQVSLRMPTGISAMTSTPAFDFHAPVANIHTSLSLPDNRWLLWTWGPTDGPAILYWSQLLVLLAVAWALARYARTPLRFHDWLLLGLGFSAVSWSAFAFVVAWLIVLGLRQRRLVPDRLRPWVFDTAQVLLILASVAALAMLVMAIPQGLLGAPDMHISGNGSDASQLNWTLDRAAGQLPHAGVLNLPQWIYKLAMLAWAVWLANASIGWLRWAFAAWSQGGYWRRRVKQAKQEGTA
ncbi:MAG TPA: hypothetical protein VIM98_17100 [Dyella sp.]|uniref:hypothetical protein n=1 Tax=Dyella sp. TaxID=1869338 RepID=UPI002F92B09F